MIDKKYLRYVHMKISIALFLTVFYLIFSFGSLRAEENSVNHFAESSYRVKSSSPTFDRNIISEVQIQSHSFSATTGGVILHRRGRICRETFCADPAQAQDDSVNGRPTTGCHPATTRGVMLAALPLFLRHCNFRR